MGQRRFTDEVLSDEMATILRKKTPGERLAIAFGMWRFAKQLLHAAVTREHPDWPEARIREEVVRRLSHGTR